jgi:hypothetical protein
MMEEVRVISSDADGKELRHERYLNPYHLRCDGKQDDGEINEAVSRVGISQWSISSDTWERIFGRK